MNEILEKLSIGDLHSEGKSEEVALEIVRNPSLLKDLTHGLGSQKESYIETSNSKGIRRVESYSLKGDSFSVYPDGGGILQVLA